jgi:hypothetical protein
MAARSLNLSHHYSTSFARTGWNFLVYPQEFVSRRVLRLSFPAVRQMILADGFDFPVLFHSRPWPIPIERFRDPLTVAVVFPCP